MDWSLLCFQRFSEDLGSFLWLFFTFSSLFRLFAWYGIGCIYRFVICRARLFVLFFSLIFGMRFLCACAGVYMKRNWDLNMFLLTSILSAKWFDNSPPLDWSLCFAAQVITSRVKLWGFEGGPVQNASLVDRQLGLDACTSKVVSRNRIVCLVEQKTAALPRNRSINYTYAYVSTNQRRHKLWW